ncbi:hypothetical protein GF337_06370 [candidate division KSB1 bacterium]|nr:hypothetical protein [candidate division KSB1 bacterium]
MQKKHIVAIGAHPGDMEISCGALLAAHRAKGNKVTIVHLTNSPKFSSRFANRLYFQQLKTEAEDAASTINAHVISYIIEREDYRFNRENIEFVLKLLNELQPTCVITHWKKSLEPDHTLAHRMVKEALSEFNSDKRIDEEKCKIFFTEHYEDRIDFEPLIYVDVSEYINMWFKMISCFHDFHESSRNKYIRPVDYYQALAKIRGRESHFSYACVFNSTHNKLQSKDIMP